MIILFPYPCNPEVNFDENGDFFVVSVKIKRRIKWNGHIELDNNILRTDAAPGENNNINLRMRFIELAVDGYRTVEKKANELLENGELNNLQKDLFERASDVEEVLKSKDIL